MIKHHNIAPPDRCRCSNHLNLRSTIGSLLTTPFFVKLKRAASLNPVLHKCGLQTVNCGTFDTKVSLSPFILISCISFPLFSYPDTPGKCDIPITNKNLDRKSTRLNSSHVAISYAVFCL